MEKADSGGAPYDVQRRPDPTAPYNEGLFSGMEEVGARARLEARGLGWSGNGVSEPFVCSAISGAARPVGPLPLRYGRTYEAHEFDWTALPELAVKMLLQQRLSLRSRSLSALEQTHRLFSAALVQAEAARRVRLLEQPRGFTGSMEPWVGGAGVRGCMRVPPRPVRGARNRRLQQCWEPWNQMLAEVERLERPLTFSGAAVPANVEVTGEHDEIVTVQRTSGVVTLVPSEADARMRAGVHQANFHILRAAPNARLCVGVQLLRRPGAAQPPSACDTALGWGWSGLGAVHNRGAARALPKGTCAARSTWAEGDTLSLRLDMDRGVLTGIKNSGEWSGVVAEFGQEAGACAMSWNVEMARAGTRVRVEWGATAAAGPCCDADDV